MNIQAQPEALDELDALGVRTIPVVRRGDRYVIGMSLDAVDEFVGIARTIDLDDTGTR